MYQGQTPSPAWGADELAALTYPAGAEVRHARAEETPTVVFAVGGPRDAGERLDRNLNWALVCIAQSCTLTKIS